ncbi:hypothetical protein [Hydrogenophaga sp.]|nr:hypothetical protein [Hydrogenophaga sp.]
MFSLWIYTMNRCLSPLLLALALVGTAHAQNTQVRNFPREAWRGEMTIKQPPIVEMDDKITRLSPGARLFDEDNRVLRPASLIGRPLTVNYLVDRRGQVTQAWVLTAEEKKQKRPSYGVERNFEFESQQTPANPRTAPARPN